MSCDMRPALAIPSADEVHEQLQRILSCQELQNSEALRRLLQYLADKSIFEHADCLKEYTVAVEGMGKPPSYDPQKSSSVRILVGRLRQKLAEYYSGAGQHDPVLIELGKGSFRLTARLRNQLSEDVTEISELDAIPAEVLSLSKSRIPKFLSRDFLIGVLVGCIALSAGWALTRSDLQRAGYPLRDMHWTPDMRALWAPFVNSRHPLIVSIEDPLFFEFQSHPSIFFRSRSMNEWDDFQKSSELRTIALHHTEAAVQPSRYFTTFGEVEAALLLGRLLGPHVEVLSLSHSSELTWNQMANNDVLFVGVQYSFFKQIKDLPIEPQLNPTDTGVMDSHPAAGGPVFYADQYGTGASDQDIVYSLVTHLPGPSGSTEVESFTSNRSAGYVAAVQWFTRPDSVKSVIEKLNEVGGGKLPSYYQVLLRVTSKDSVPTNVAFVLARALH